MANLFLSSCTLDSFTVYTKYSTILGISYSRNNECPVKLSLVLQFKGAFKYTHQEHQMPFS